MPDLNPDQRRAVTLAVRRLEMGGLVAFPTETVYGLGADALNEAAVRSVFTAKGRPANNPLIVHVSGPTMAFNLVKTWPREAEILARAFWPGPLTLVLPKLPHVPEVVTGGGPNVAVRCPDHPLTLALITQLNRGIVGPSANKSGLTSPTTAEHVRESFPHGVLIVDGGPCRVGLESTVVSLVDAVSNPLAPIRVLRPGFIAPHQIATALRTGMNSTRGVEFLEPAATPNNLAAPLESPGLTDRHYAPAAEAIRFEPHQRESAMARIASSPSPIVITHRRELLPAGLATKVAAMPKSPADYAQVLYDALRRADSEHPSLIAIEFPTETDHPLWDAIRDRLRRAATPI